MKVQPYVCSGHKLAAHVMKSYHINAHNLKIHIKQRLNEIHRVEKLMKKVKNHDNETQRWLSQHNHLILDEIIDDFKRLGPIRLV